MTTAIGAMHFGAGHEQALVHRGANGAFNEGIKAGPAGAAVILGFGGKEWLCTAGAHKGASAFLVIKGRGKGALGPFVAEHVIGARR